MKSVAKVVNEHKDNFYLILRLSLYELKIKYVSSRLGIGWVLLNPLIQIMVYWVVFGLGIRGGAPVDGVPFFVWLICGLIPWFFVSSGITNGSNSLIVRLSTASKMNFPLSIIPTIAVFSQLYTHIVLVLLLIVIVAFTHGVFGAALFGLIFFILSLVCFLIALSFLTSTLSIIMRDIHILIQSLTRMLFFLTPIMWTLNHKSPRLMTKIMEWNPIYYIIRGYRSVLLYGDLSIIWTRQAAFFWGLTLLLFFIGTLLHIKLRKHFVDYL